MLYTITIFSLIIHQSLARRALPYHKYKPSLISSRSHRSSPISLVRAKTKSTRKTKLKQSTDDYPKNLVPHTDSSEESSEPTLQEIRASLGPVGKTIAGGVEVGVITAGSYVSGGIMGYGIGSVFGIRTLFQSSSKMGFKAELKGRMGNFHAKAMEKAQQWASLSAAFSGFHALTRVARGGKEDKWNGILGSAATGAFLSRKGKYPPLLLCSLLSHR